MSGTHFKGPILGDSRAWAGAGKNVPMQGINADDWAVVVHDYIDGSELDTTNAYTATDIGGASNATQTSATNSHENAIGSVVIVAGGAQQGAVVQLDGQGFYSPQASGASALSSEAVVAVRFRMNDVANSSLFVGLSEINSTNQVLNGTTGALESDTHAGFAAVHTESVSAGLPLTLTSAGQDDTSANTEASGITLADDEWIDVAVRVLGTQQATFYARRSELVGPRGRSAKPWVKLSTVSPTDAAWDTGMFPTVAFLGEALNDQLRWDKLVFALKRDLTIG